MSQFPTWFDSDYYAEQKVLQMNTIKYNLDWLENNFHGSKKWTIESYEQYLSEYQFDGKHITAYDNFLACNTCDYNLSSQYPYIDIKEINVSCNKFFNIPVYIQNLTDYFNNNEFDTENHAAGEWTNNATLQYIYKDLHMSAWEHYKIFGTINQINPSNEFDTYSYLLARAEKTDSSIDEVIEDLLNDDLNPIMDYHDFGVKNGIKIVPVANPVTPAVPENWTQWGYSEVSDLPDTPQTPDNPYLPEPDYPQYPETPDSPNQPTTPNNPITEPDRFEAEGNNNKDDAIILSENTGTLGNLTITTDDQDWFKISLNGKGTHENFIQVQLDQTDVAFNLTLYNASGEIVTEKTITAGNDKISLENIEIGEYFAVISGNDGATGNYLLKWNANAQEDKPENPDYNFEFVGHGFSRFGDNDYSTFTIYMKNLPENCQIPSDRFTIRSKDTISEVKSIVIEDNKVKINVDPESIQNRGALIEYHPDADDVDNALANAIADYLYKEYQNGNLLNSWSLNNGSAMLPYENQGEIINQRITFDNDVDYYEFTIDRKQTKDDYITINFNHDDGDLNVILYEYRSLYEDGEYRDKPIYYATSQTDNETINLNNLIPTWEDGKETYRLKVFGRDNATNDYSIEYKINSGESSVGDFNPAVNYAPIISNMPKNIALSKEMLLNSAVGIQTVKLPETIKINDLEGDQLTVSLESKESQFARSSNDHDDLFTISDNGHKIVFTCDSDECDYFLSTITLEPTATAISKMKGNINPFITVDISVTDGNNITSSSFAYRSDDFIASHIKVQGEPTDISGTEYIYINGITEEGIKSFQNNLLYNDNSIFDADKIEKHEDSNMCWAATVSNMLAWTEWGKVINNHPDYDNIIHKQENDIEDIIFSLFKKAFPNKAGFISDGVEWFFDGSIGNLHDEEIKEKGNLIGHTSDVSTIKVGSVQDMNNLALQLRSGAGVGLTIYTENELNGITEYGAHALTCWGYAYDSKLNSTNPNYYTGLIISDSNDGSSSNGKCPDVMRYLPIEWSDQLQRYVFETYKINNDQYLLHSATILPQMNSESTPLHEYGALPFGNVNEYEVANYINDSILGA